MAARALASRDLEAPRQEFLVATPSWLRAERLLNDKRDAPALYLLFNVSTVALPAAIALHALPSSHWLGLLYFVINYALFLQRFLLTLHVTEHRRLFRPGLPAGLDAVLAAWAPCVLCPLYGIPSGAYRLHHCAMHHVEDNGAPGDLTSTEPFQRDSLPQFLAYWARFAVAGAPELFSYAWRAGRRGWALQAAASMAAYGAGIALLWRRNWVATFWTLALPYLASSLALMLGNWSQHVFVNPARPGEAHGLTYTCLACPDNRRTYNDGYHIQHHANSRLHWSELPRAFAASLAQHDEKDALVFGGIGVFDVGLAVLTGRLGWLADRLVPCGLRQAARSRDQWVRELRARLAPVRRPAAAAAAGGRRGQERRQPGASSRVDQAG